MLATNRDAVSLGGGGVAAFHFINSTKPSKYIDFTGRSNTPAIPGFMAGILKLKSLADQKVTDAQTSEKIIYTHSNKKMINTDLGKLIFKAKEFIEQKIAEKHADFADKVDGQPNSHLLKALTALSKNPRSFYDKGLNFFNSQFSNFPNSWILNIVEIFKF